MVTKFRDLLILTLEKLVFQFTFRLINTSKNPILFIGSVEGEEVKLAARVENVREEKALVTAGIGTSYVHFITERVYYLWCQQKKQVSL
jgi:hypothetical protein